MVPDPMKLFLDPIPEASPVRNVKIDQPHKGRDRTIEPAALFPVPGLPPYSVPTMAEIQATPHNGLTAVSTFSGAGGSSLGLTWAGWRIPYAVEFIDSAADTYAANFPTTFVNRRDIRSIEPEEILSRLGMDRGELDLLEGSPPCSSFSPLGFGWARSRGMYGQGKVKVYSDKVRQTTDDLFSEWLRLVDGLRPRAVIAENVPALQEATGAALFREVLSALNGLGYLVSARIFRANHYGAATMRRRLIIRGIRRDVGPLPPVPKPTNQSHSIGDALSTLPIPLPADELDHARGTPRLRDEWSELAIGQTHFWRQNFSRVAPAGLLPGVTAGGALIGASDPCHWAEARKFTATELKWAFGFPADFVLTGEPKQRYERIARAVSPPLYRAVGRTMALGLLGGTHVDA